MSTLDMQLRLRAFALLEEQQKLRGDTLPRLVYLFFIAYLAGKGVKEMLCLIGRRPVLDRAVSKLSAPGEAEAGSAGTQPSRGIAR